VLGWPAISGRQYNLQSTMNLTTAFQTVTNIVATNSMIQWPLATTGNAAFYRVQVSP